MNIYSTGSQSRARPLNGADHVDPRNLARAAAGAGIELKAPAGVEHETGVPVAIANGSAASILAEFQSILFEDAGTRETAAGRGVPQYFRDLNLDQVVDAITAGKEEYDLKSFFYTPLASVGAIEYRHAVMRDLEGEHVVGCVTAFAQKMHSVREHLVQTEKLYYQRQKESWFLDAVHIYCEAVDSVAENLTAAQLRSRGFLAFRMYLSDYVASEAFTRLVRETRKLRTHLATVRYTILIKDNAFTVRKYGQEPDYSADVERTFEKFKQGAVKSYAVRFSEYAEMNHVEAKALEFVAQLHHEIFADLEDYRRRNVNFLDETIKAFDREVQFYIAYLEYIRPLRDAGLKFTYPAVSSVDKTISDKAGYDLALAHKLVAQKRPVVTNDFQLKDKERILVVSGPNQGGKTTLARMFGQLHYLANIGCLVPGTEARLFLFDRLFTHFEKEEEIATLRGKLEDDLFRIQQIIGQATSNSIIVMNEIFNSTTLNDAVFLGKEIIQRIADMDSLCVCVTFVDELASLNEKTVSMVSTVVPENPAERTFKVVRRPADGLSYALSIADKYRLTYESLMQRVPS